MDEQIQTISTVSDKFKFGKKWFWIGAAVAVLNIFAGLIYGIALAKEKDHRKEGAAIISLSIIVFIVLAFLIKKGLIFAF